MSNTFFLKKINLRLDSIAYHFLAHLNFFQSFFHLRKYIMYKGLLINGKLCKNPNRFLSSYDIIELTPTENFNFFYFLFKTRFCNWLKYHQKQLLVIQKFRKKLEKRIYTFFLIRKYFRNKYLKFIYRLLFLLNKKKSINLKSALKCLKMVLKQ